MHELSLASAIVEACDERACGTRVRRVCLLVGALSCVLPESLTFCFEVAAKGTALEGASLEIEMVPAASRCRDCGGAVLMREIFAACGCGSLNLEPPRGGNELRILSIEIEEAA
jgi:hydrogenase nickel incorporation protein HypA/HybF